MNIRNNIPGLLRNIYSSPGILFLEFRNIIPGAQEYYSWSSGILFLEFRNIIPGYLPAPRNFSSWIRAKLPICPRDFCQIAQISRDLLDFSSWFAQNSRYVLKFLGNFVAINTNLSLRNFINDSGVYSHSTIHSTTKNLKTLNIERST